MIQLGGEKFKFIDVFPKILTVPDSFVVRNNKIQTTKDKTKESHGEAKLYISSKDIMRDFYGHEGFRVTCFMLKQDLINYLNTLKTEYLNPSQAYRGMDSFAALWEERMNKVKLLQDEIIIFEVSDQTQIKGPRGYVNSSDKGYKLIRELSLPLISYILVKKLSDNAGSQLYYWKLFVDFDAIEQMKSLPTVFTYGKSKMQDQEAENIETQIEEEVKTIKRGRDGQQKYREKLLEQCPFCPFTMVADDRLLIASHIKPWAVADENERTDPYNGYMLTPTYDRLFDQGFITFTEDRHVHISNFLSKRTCKQLGLEDDKFIQMLPMDKKRIKYLEFHKQSVFKD